MLKPQNGPGTRWYRRGWSLIGSLLLCLCIQSVEAETASPYPEDAVKAIFLYRFAGYVTWPPSAAPAARFTIAVAGDDRIAAELSAFLPTHPVGDHPSQVRRISGPEEVGDAQIVYLGADYRGDVRAFTRKLAQSPVLLVTDRQDGLAIGSIVNFVIIDGHVRFEISQPAAARAGLKISAQLLAVASRVNTGWLGPPSFPFMMAAR